MEIYVRRRLGFIGRICFSASISVGLHQLLVALFIRKIEGSGRRGLTLTVYIFLTSEWWNIDGKFRPNPSKSNTFILAKKPHSGRFLSSLLIWNFILCGFFFLKFIRFLSYKLNYCHQRALNSPWRNNIRLWRSWQNFSDEHWWPWRKPNWHMWSDLLCATTHCIFLRHPQSWSYRHWSQLASLLFER